MNNAELCSSCSKEAKQAAEECGDCKRPVKNRDRGLEYEVCEHWFHIGCEKVTVHQYDFLRQEENQTIPWTCRLCRGNLIHYARDEQNPS